MPSWGELGRVKGTGEPQVAIRSHSGISLEQARDARARAWAFVFQCWQQKEMAAEPAPELDSHDDAKESNGCIATGRISRGH
jgi:hypothetical protein